MVGPHLLVCFGYQIPLKLEIFSRGHLTNTLRSENRHPQRRARGFDTMLGFDAGIQNEFEVALNPLLGTMLKLARHTKRAEQNHAASWLP
jgi:hypothetical protein